MALLDRFFQEINYPESLMMETKRKSLVADLLEPKSWGERLTQFAPLIVEGKEHIESAQATSRGVILARLHQKLGNGRPSSPLSHWINEQEFRPSHIISARGNEQKGVAESFRNAQSLFQAFNALHKGKVIHMAPDGFHGAQAINIEFYGHLRAFRTGFAELALATQAHIIPICLHFKKDGAIVIKISPALQLLDGGTREEKIASLVNQYVAVLNEFWASQTHMIPYPQLRKHLACPKVL